jgi:hypothetical protein
LTKRLFGKFFVLSGVLEFPSDYYIGPLLNITKEKINEKKNLMYGMHEMGQKLELNLKVTP